MAIYPTDHSSDVATWRASIAALLTASGFLDTLHYSAGNDIIFSLTNFTTKVFRLNVGTGFSWSPVVYVGDAYTSGTTITNQLTVWNNSANITRVFEAFIITSNVFAYTCRNLAGDRVQSFAMAKGTDTGKEYLLPFGINYTSAMHCRNCTDDLSVEANGLRLTTLLTALGNYYKSPIVTTHLSQILDSSLVDLKIIHRATVGVDSGIAVGDDAIINALRANGDVNYLNSMLLIEGGNL